MTEQTGNNKPNEAEGLAFPRSGYDGRPGFLSLSGMDAGRIAKAILAAGFHRSMASDSSVETWVCGKCGGDAYEHSLTTSTCIWEPIETRPAPQCEPSDHRDRIALAEFIDKALDGDAGYGVGEFLAGGILSFLSERSDLHAAFAQPEPSDAQVLAALNAWNVINPGESLSDYADANVSHMRAALRAAGVGGVR